VLRLDGISKIYPQGEVLRDVTWEIKSGDRIGLVGPNGGGKSTQFKIIMGLIEPTSGQVIKNPGCKIGYLEQEFDVIQSNTVKDEFFRSFQELNDIHEALTKVHKQLETVAPEALDKLLRRMDSLQAEYEVKGGYLQEGKIDKMMQDMGFAPGDGDRLVREFSGGWQMRMNLGKVLLQKPDVLLLDEPTNHIDLETIEWLEGYLRSITTPMAVISHDRHFLDRVCTSIVEMERGISTVYNGNYSSYIEQRQMNRDAQLAAFERQQKEVARQQVFVDRFRASATRSTQAKSREKQLDKVELLEAPESEERTLQFQFAEAPRSGRQIARVNQVTHVYDEKIIFGDVNLEIERGDKIALLGRNGSGKSTFLRLLCGKEEPFDGEVALGLHNVNLAYFEQNQAEALDLEKTVLDTIAEQVPTWETKEVRGLLGRFLFPGDSVFKKVCNLSGGEKARLALAKMLTGPNNFLVLDEPTNHLDIPAKETLEDALKSFPGAIVVVSHDRYFLSQVANKIVEMDNNNLRLFHGNYNYYLEIKAKEKEDAVLAAENAAAEARRRAKRDKELAKKKTKA
jgi:ATP-binding cassette subfamily F protein 3